MDSPSIVVVAHNIRSAHNIGSIFRTCDGFSVTHLYLTGYSPYPHIDNDHRLPHIAQRTTAEIAKTALGAEQSVTFSHLNTPFQLLDGYKAHGYEILGLEQDETATPLPQYQPAKKIVLVLGEEVNGIPGELMKACTQFVEIPMQGAKESYNVSVATGIALYALTTHTV